MRLAALLVVASCLLPFTPGQAAPHRAQLTSEVVLRGSRPVSVDVTLARPATLHAGDLFDAPRAAFESTRVGAGYALVSLEHAYDPPRLVGVRAPKGPHSHGIQLPSGVDADGNHLIRTLRLPAGRYRLYLFTEGPAVVRFRLPGAPAGRTAFAPSRPEAVGMRRADATPATRPTGAVLGDARTVTAEQNLIVATVAARLAPSPTGYESWWCLYEGGPPPVYAPRCLNASDGIGVANRIPAFDNTYTGFSSFTNVEPGSWAVSRSVDAVGQIHDQSSYFVWIPMPLGRPPTAPSSLLPPVDLDLTRRDAGGSRQPR